jgi:hypothetical protein
LNKKINKKKQKKLGKLIRENNSMNELIPVRSQKELKNKLIKM